MYKKIYNALSFYLLTCYLTYVNQNDDFYQVKRYVCKKRRKKQQQTNKNIWNEMLHKFSSLIFPWIIGWGKTFFSDSLVCLIHFW